MILCRDQAEAHRQKNKASRQRRAERVAAKRDTLIGVAAVAEVKK
jgi:hypothetical protein